jgi:hypothetical protein
LFSFDPSLYRFTADEDVFLDEVEQACFLYFWEQANANTGQIEDRGSADGGTPRKASSVAATGFGLTALCVAARRRWEDAAAKVACGNARFAPRKHPTTSIFHFINGEAGQRIAVGYRVALSILMRRTHLQAYFDNKWDLATNFTSQSTGRGSAGGQTLPWVGYRTGIPEIAMGHLAG